jgi:hypothetical protein
MIFWYVYKTTCLINKKIYVGVHKSNKLNNNYIGCGVVSQKSANRRSIKIKSPFVQAVARHGYNNFKKEIIKVFDNEFDAYKMEEKIVNENWVKSKDNYNASLGGKISRLPSKYSHLFEKWKSMYESGMTMKAIAMEAGLSSHAKISIILDGMTIKRPKYITANKIRKMKLFCQEKNKTYNSQRDFLKEEFGSIKSQGNLSEAIKNNLKYKGLTVFKI